uniref:Mitochondrial import receptor subunit TOM22 homolog n=1 Tax=Glossina austeni TaxID=7395 RepID=A0A1A9UK36_GLOAU
MPTTDREYLQSTIDYQDPDRERGGGKKGGTHEENFEDEPDETISERLWGLAEMFPEPLREFTCAMVCLTSRGVRAIYRFSCSASWILFTTSIILFAPVVFETERAQMEEMQKQEQKQVLLGPGSAMAAIGGPTPKPIESQIIVGIIILFKGKRRDKQYNLPKPKNWSCMAWGRASQGGYLSILEMYQKSTTDSTRCGVIEDTVQRHYLHIM